MGLKKIEILMVVWEARVQNLKKIEILIFLGEEGFGFKCSNSKSETEGEREREKETTVARLVGLYIYSIY